ncbi:hypothetical protein GGX14DRAFT_596422 [Mycena pura]|uniref:Uncharacterized protein n=1 Tax=Mycena pura TaxID=153505 RepID=A0AAD6Y599_9AGAR|nr:hypothetical protein GGX14DRAFT_596422 [Mycena pura]
MTSSAALTSAILALRTRGGGWTSSLRNVRVGAAEMEARGLRLAAHASRKSCFYCMRTQRTTSIAHHSRCLPHRAPPVTPCLRRARLAAAECACFSVLAARCQQPRRPPNAAWPSVRSLPAPNPLCICGSFPRLLAASRRYARLAQDLLPAAHCSTARRRSLAPAARNALAARAHVEQGPPDVCPRTLLLVESRYTTHRRTPPAPRAVPAPRVAHRVRSCLAARLSSVARCSLSAGRFLCPRP